MALFNKKGVNDTRTKILNGAPELIPSIAKSVITYFKSNGYETLHQVSDNNSHEIQVQKAGTFGLKTVIKLTITPLHNNRINIQTTDYGLFDSKLDDEAIRIAELIAATTPVTTSPKAKTPSGGVTSILQQQVSRQINTLKTSQPTPAPKPNKPNLGGTSGKGSW